MRSRRVRSEVLLELEKMAAIITRRKTTPVAMATSLKAFFGRGRESRREPEGLGAAWRLSAEIWFK